MGKKKRGRKGGKGRIRGTEQTEVGSEERKICAEEGWKGKTGKEEGRAGLKKRRKIKGHAGRQDCQGGMEESREKER